MIETDVLIMGSGPAGSAAALALSTSGIRNILVTKYRWLADTPRAHISNQRTMEVLRDLGVEEEVAARGAPQELMGNTHGLPWRSHGPFHRLHQGGHMGGHGEGRWAGHAPWRRASCLPGTPWGHGLPHGAHALAVMADDGQPWAGPWACHGARWEVDGDDERRAP
nr:FAD-dependent monooxygenase [Methylobacterium sp. XJLW]